MATAMTSPDKTLPPSRIAALDFLRGCAVLGILAINVTGFWGPQLASLSPALPRPDHAGTVWFVIAFLLFDGKMRGLFTLLFGASMVLFVQSVERRGLSGDAMQVRRLLWLLLFGYLHYALLWWGTFSLPMRCAACWRWRCAGSNHGRCWRLPCPSSCWPMPSMRWLRCPRSPGSSAC
jgi:uncharacterized protein